MTIKIILQMFFMSKIDIILVQKYLNALHISGILAIKIIFLDFTKLRDNPNLA